MRFFIFTCLLAVALAKHEMKHLSSSEESAQVFPEKIELTDEEKVYLKQLKKINQFYQELKLPQYCQAYAQHQIVMNPWNYMKTKAFRLTPVLESASISQEETLKKITDRDTPSSSSSEVKINQVYRKFAFLQYPQPLHPQQIAMNPWRNIKFMLDMPDLDYGTFNCVYD
ncbi:alpha-S2-casein-like [Trichechus manatus latirostris]|uniref:Alpha-S2-casein-like n=1 Tax=Trichechus manatus latirostris TaxID=127582 RepID=A0A2Y9G1I9_TRIMA|nr:alpha-S2-casein-like [Trichechus manatus latirostris]